MPLTNHLQKLVVIPGATHSLGGTLVSLALLIEGFKRLGATEKICVLVPADSFMQKYLQSAGLDFCLKIIPAEPEHQAQFLERALSWVNQQPRNYSVLLDNCVWRSFMPILLRAAINLRLQNRPVYHFCHDLALSHNICGYFARKLTFAYLAPRVICNSHFTASHVRSIMPDIRGILYQPVDTKKFNSCPPTNLPPEDLKPILASGSRIILTPSRITEPGMVNDKNLRSLIPVLADLVRSGHNYHWVVIGEDNSPNRIRSQTLIETANNYGVGDKFTILSPTFAIENYYKYADVVVTLAPREPFGRVVVEAIACGVPVIGSQTGGIGEILNHFAPEWTVDPNNPEAVAQTIVRVAEDPNTCNVLKQGQTWVENNCSIEEYTARLMAITGVIPIAPPEELSAKI
ncbi:MAG: glycosyltransferase family 4 protein [Nostocaceae cyanobacterium]|nr:glycosyltransferase family 4 protein [Nostocaceae cyanobacterium]